MSSPAPSAPVASSATATAAATTAAVAQLTKKVLLAAHPTWCPGCGDFAVLASFYRVLEIALFEEFVERGEHREVTAAGAPGWVVSGDCFLG